MTIHDFSEKISKCRLIASVQASEGSPVDDPQTLLKLAQASVGEGVQILLLQGIENIRTIRLETGIPVIGLIKKQYPESQVYISPTSAEVASLVSLGCEIVALDGTNRTRPGNDSLADLIGQAHSGGALVMADCDSLGSAEFSLGYGADLIGTTLAGYTDARPATLGPDLELLRALVKLGRPVVAEGRFSALWQVEAALRIGAVAVVVGGALNDPVKQTRALSPTPPVSASDLIGAVDIGGTWLRFGLFTSDWKLIESDRIPNPPNRLDRLSWIRAHVDRSQATRLGVSTGGMVDPATGVCWNAKEYLMPDQIGVEFSERTLGVPTWAHGDGHAAAWAHACLPQFAGRRVATLALGTGVGCGFVQEGRIWSGKRGEYPRINDLPTSTGKTYEEVLGGLNLTTDPTNEQQIVAVQALEDALFAVRNLYFPDDVVIGGSVGLSEWLAPHLARLGAIPSPFGTDAGLYGAAALAIFPPP